MQKLLNNFENSTLAFILSLVWWVLSIITFGDFHSLTQWIILPTSTLTMSFLVNFRWRSNKDNRVFGPTFWYAFMGGIFLSLFGLSPFIFSIRETVVSFTIDTSFGVIGWWIAILGFMPAANTYRKWKREELDHQFQGDLTSLERDFKIQQIVGKWWK